MHLCELDCNTTCVECNAEGDNQDLSCCLELTNARGRGDLYLWHNVSLARAGSHCKGFLDLPQEQGEWWVDA